MDDAIAQAIRSRIYITDDLDYIDGIDTIVLTGAIECEGAIRIEVTEQVRVLRPVLIQTTLVGLESYRYSALLAKGGPIFRYDSPHDDHRQFHHVHRFDVLGSRAEEVSELRERDVPTLRQIVSEAADWHWNHLGR